LNTCPGVGEVISKAGGVLSIRIAPEAVVFDQSPALFLALRRK